MPKSVLNRGDLLRVLFAGELDNSKDMIQIVGFVPEKVHPEHKRIEKESDVSPIEQQELTPELKSFLNRGDLSRALFAGELDNSKDEIQLIDFVPEKVLPEHKLIEKESDASPIEQQELTPEPIKIDRQQEISEESFWQPIWYQPIEHPDTEDEAPSQVLTIPKRKEKIEPPQYQYLAEFGQLIPRLRKTLSLLRCSKSIDSSKMVQRVSRGELLERIPLKHRMGWGASLYIIEDRSDYLTPYHRDQAMVQDELKRLYPKLGFFSALYHELLDWPQVFSERKAPLDINPQAGDQILVLSDLGTLVDNGGSVAQFWLRFGQTMQQKGINVTALLPCHPEAVAHDLPSVYQFLTWEHPEPKQLSRNEIKKQSMRIIQSLSLAARITPGLLRAIRFSLSSENPHQPMPAAVESWVWQSIGESNNLGANLDTYQQKEGMEGFQQDISTRNKTARIVKQWMQNHPYELWLSQLLQLDHWAYQADIKSGAAPLITAQEKQDAEDFILYLAAKSRQEKQGTFTQRTIHWIERLVIQNKERHPNNKKLQNALRELEKAIQQNRLREIEHNRSLSNQPKKYTLYCDNNYHWLVKLHNSHIDSIPEKNSPLITIPSKDQFIQIEEPFWQAGKAPHWAEDWGRDNFGPWVEFEVNGVRQRMRWIPPGKFLMGSPENEPGRDKDEGPQHLVTISEGYWFFDTPVTQALWESVMGDNPSRFKSPQRPVDTVSWDDAQEFLLRINQFIPDLELNLPSESQWEYACRAGTQTSVYWGDINVVSNENDAELIKMIRCMGNVRFRQSEVGTLSVGLKPANPWGLYDMLGNVKEWVQDHWQEDYRVAPDDGGALVKSGWVGRVLRGGSWNDFARVCRSATRVAFHPDFRSFLVGFRCAPVQNQQAQPIPSGAPSQAEREAARKVCGGAVQLRSTQDKLPISPSIQKLSQFLIRTDCAQIGFKKITRPQWADAIGRDQYGLWSEFSIDSPKGKVVQRLRWIPPGEFIMGSPEDEAGRYDNEGPQKKVVIEKGYWLFDTPVTQVLWLGVMGENPSYFKDPKRPVEWVSWDDCQKFLHDINQKIPGLNLSLPSEAQWEYACRAGTQSTLYSGDIKILGKKNAAALDEIAWYGGNSGERFDLKTGITSEGWEEKQYPHTQAGTRRVKQKRANSFGLYDMLGNVWEWIEDDWKGNYKQTPENGEAYIVDERQEVRRVLRGGSWGSNARVCRSATRSAALPDDRSYDTGFRCALVQD